MVRLLRGQGATEYLVLLAVVLVIALVSIALLGFFPGMSTDAKIAQSASYWSAARPFAVISHKVNTTGSATLIVQNNDATGMLIITNASLGGGSMNPSLTLAPGESNNITISGVGSGTAGSVYDLGLNFTYTNAYGITSNKQFGAKNLVGKYV
jgi:hypothetical protein